MKRSEGSKGVRNCFSRPRPAARWSAVWTSVSAWARACESLAERERVLSGKPQDIAAVHLPPTVGLAFET